MMTARDFSGTWPAVVTPFAGRREVVDTVSLGTLCRDIMSAGCEGLVVLGTIGEGPSVAEGDREVVIRTAVESADGGTRVIVGVAAADTASACRLARQAADAGAEAVMLLPPTGHPCDADEVIGHYSAVAAASEIPLIAYNHPEVSAGNIVDLSSLETLCGTGAVHAIKETTTESSRLEAIRDLVSDDFQLITGPDKELPLYLEYGSTAWMPGTGNFLPSMCVRVLTLGLRQQDLEFRVWLNGLWSLMALDSLDEGWAALKYVGARTGFPVGSIDYIGPLPPDAAALVESAVQSIEWLQHGVAVGA